MNEAAKFTGRDRQVVKDIDPERVSVIDAEDDSTIRFRPQPLMIPKARELPSRRIDRKFERGLLLGWSYKAPIIIREYAGYVLEGSPVDVMLKDPPPELAATIRGLDQETSVHVSLAGKDPLIFDELASMSPFLYNHVIILPQKQNDADASYGVTLIPSKGSEVTLDKEDGLVVVAEDDR